MATLFALTATLAWVWAVRTRPDRPLHPVAVVALVLLAVLLVAVPLLAAAAGPCSCPSLRPSSEAGPADTGEAAIAMVLDPVTVSVVAGIVAAGALTLRLGRRRPQG